MNDYDTLDDDSKATLGPLHEFKLEVASLADSDSPSQLATFVATWAFCVAIGGMGTWLGWWSVAELLLGAVGGGFLVSIGVVFTGTIVAVIVPFRLGFVVAQIADLVGIAAVVHALDGNPAAALVLSPIPVVIYPVVFWGTRRHGQRALIDAGVDRDLRRELNSLPICLASGVVGILDAAVCDYREIHLMLKTSATSDPGIQAAEIRASAQAVLTAMLHRAAAVSRLAYRAQRSSVDSPVQSLAEQALVNLEIHAKSLHDTALSLTTHVAQLDDLSRYQLQEHVQHLEDLHAAMAELPNLE